MIVRGPVISCLKVMRCNDEDVMFREIDFFGFWTSVRLLPNAHFVWFNPVSVVKLYTLVYESLKPSHFERGRG